MKATTVPAPTNEVMRITQAKEHSDCFACASPGGLGIEFQSLPNEDITADWQPSASHQSYQGILHGGLIATLVDGAMVHALFARGIVGKTGELTIRYYHSLVIDRSVHLRARLCSAHPPLYCLESEIYQQGVLCAKAKAKFVSTSGLSQS